MKAVIYGEEFPCSRVVKGPDWVRLYQNGEEVRTFLQISDFAGYSLEGGEWEAPPADPRDAALAQLMREVALLKVQGEKENV